MPLIRLIYFSENHLDLHKGPFLQQLRDILRTSNRNNKADDITGALVFDDFWFGQVLEGERAKVLATLDRIREDERHSHLAIVQVCDIENRMFGNWWMGLATRNEATLAAFIRYERNGVLKFDQMPGNEILRLIVDVAKLQPSRLMYNSAA